VRVILNDLYDQVVQDNGRFDLGPHATNWSITSHAIGTVFHALFVRTTFGSATKIRGAILRVWSVNMGLE